VQEAFEPAAAGRGGSSTMPHKRNPVGSVVALAAATLAPQHAATILAAMVQEHERATGGWQAEWPTFPALLMAASAGLAAIVDIAEGLEVDPARMRANLDATHGLIMAEAVSFALAVKLGKSDAHKLVEEAGRKAVAEKRGLKDVLADDKRVTAHLSTDELTRLFDPLSYQGAAQTFIDRQLASNPKT
jgi:3-carboxy-cis,cis-muconate cycloisomerase